MPKLKMYPARNGDAFLVEVAGQHILIDAGYASTFRDEIAPDLLELHQAGRRLSLAVCTHVDADHIGGMIEFIGANGAPGARRIIEVDQFWHNGLRSLPAASGAADNSADRQLLQAIQRRGFSIEVGASPEAQPISARQGSSLARLLAHYQYRWNGDNGLRCVQMQTMPGVLVEGVEVHVIGPPVGRLHALRGWWLSELRQLSYKGSGRISDLAEDAYEMWLASERLTPIGAITSIAAGEAGGLKDLHIADTSLTNGSSIAFVLQGEGARLLFLGDAWADDVIAAVPANGSAPVVFDAIKISHHGSRHNSSVELLQRVDAPCFLISSDGSRHGHPDFEVLAEIVDRPAAFKRQIHFNYDTPAARKLSQHVSKSGASFSVHIGRSDWITIGETRT
ncbi:AVAST type 1 anti-phage system MBL fold metallo-hydrolase Avs1a [Xanthomonas campestris pv. raphani]|uniref:AVAST type 1 anti-phage system MBL fold metallo-hydrolase Avs1a n=1 Tax=Xanthomonas campestris TaxID=339 RepID=UPI002B231F68|nr:AVAST type 1 anti-phage system MBL fold metallo-hydrolase Avs1a [Xanthomonas campestris]MEA9830474.1 AVAST type 1 anti-phage system MBL fold metallo-hydrolase Avs1a [Xanthomonas campestris pv. raphani]MEA9951451.1 AVAST type 1 anti-phage system MBL fold metallo-hydrolase Avs1a [Xanthomonas campestris pv. raphani]